VSTEITISIDKNRLRSYTDSSLAVAWHVAQANPAPIGDADAGELAEVVGWEIIRRWLSTVEPELWHHQGRHYFSIELRKFARYVPPAGCSALSDEFHHGHWVAREQTADESAVHPNAD
jgi:hypothetical protein